MSAPLFPADAADESLVALLGEHSAGASALYGVVVIATTAVLISLPLVRVPVTIRSPGMIQPSLERQTLRSAHTGTVEAVHVEVGARVARGAVMATIRPGGLEQRRVLLVQQRQEAERRQSDLLRLTGAADSAAIVPPARLLTARYRQEAEELRQVAGEYRIRTASAGRELSRAEWLLERGLAARADAERLRSEVERLRAEQALARQRALSGWQRSLDETRAELARIRHAEEEASADAASSRIVAPVAGSVVQMGAIVPGSYVQAGEPVAVISPDAELLAEVLVAPRHIAQIRPGGTVRLQVDALHSYEWGVATGRVREVPGDAVMLDGRPVFRVRVALDRDHLSLPSGARGELRKGMTLQAHFVLTERSLWQLLRDSASDWSNAAQRRPAY